MRYYSQFCEDALLDGLFRKFGTVNRWCFEAGAADGLWLSNTRAFIEQDWKAVLVESNPEQFAKLKKNSLESYCFNEIISVDNGIDDILARTPAPKNLDLVSIDIDGQDYYVWRDMRKYRARIVVIEYSPYVKPDYLPKLNTDGKDGRNQAGIDVMRDLARQKNYTVITQTVCNLICTADEVCRMKRVES